MDRAINEQFGNDRFVTAQMMCSVKGNSSSGSTETSVTTRRYGRPGGACAPHALEQERSGVTRRRRDRVPHRVPWRRRRSSRHPRWSRQPPPLRSRTLRTPSAVRQATVGPQTQVPMDCRRRSRLASLLSENAALKVNEYLCRPSQNLTALTGRVSAAARTGNIRRTQSSMACYCRTQLQFWYPKTSSASGRPRCRRVALCISGHFPGRASSRRHGFRTVRIPVYCPKEI